MKMIQYIKKFATMRTGNSPYNTNFSLGEYAKDNRMVLLIFHKSPKKRTKKTGKRIAFSHCIVYTEAEKKIVSWRGTDEKVSDNLSCAVTACQRISVCGQRP
ncbi:MAG: hypothetical protein SOV91_00665 [Eubacteriales bacterium]|nr:hypothetical protein [Eubacteriales bacterium]